MKKEELRKKVGSWRQTAEGGYGGLDPTSRDLSITLARRRRIEMRSFISETYVIPSYNGVLLKTEMIKEDLIERFPGIGDVTSLDLKFIGSQMMWLRFSKKNYRGSWRWLIQYKHNGGPVKVSNSFKDANLCKKVNGIWRPNYEKVLYIMC